ncbi:type IV pili methyl-accepting chemotaxis transducer N-terminal domain-containing protein [bacterium]|nr:type IV pili methyl-accepting chemotaxis transducer N-terminal domain-containing protein [bacterium]
MKTTHSIRKAFLASAAICVGLMTQVSATQAQSDTGFDGSKARVNFSSKLEMLSQNIGSASCRLSAGIGVESAKTELSNARDDFNMIMNGLEEGNMTLGIPSGENNYVVLESLQEVRSVWRPIDFAVEVLLSGTSNNVSAAEVIAGDNLRLLSATQILASDISGTYSNPHELTQADAMAISIAGRQRTLGHQITKEVCGIATGDEKDASENLSASLDMFAVSLEALRSGMVDAGVNPPPNDIIKAELEKVNQSWEQNSSTLQSIRGGMQPTAENVEDLAQVSSGLTTEMSNVVTLYMLATPGQEDVYRVPLRAYAEDQLSKWLENDQLIEAIREQNRVHADLSQAQIDQLDLDWRAQRKADEKPLINRLLNLPASAWLRDQQNQTASFVTEVFAMDNHGLNVAQSVETSDYWQGDEAKWQNTFGNGSGDIHISEVEYDDSTGTYQSQVSMPVLDPATGEMLGAITFGINVQSLL